MRRLCLVLLLAACSDSAQTDGPSPSPDSRVADAPAPDAVADGGTVHAVPDPGTGPMPQSWPDTEPNDTPEQAVALGVGPAQIGPYVGLFGAGGHLGGGDEADWFVFRTGHAPGTSFIATACWDPGLKVNLLDFALYQVVEGQPLALVAESRQTANDCERPQPFWNLPLAPDAVYLFGLFHVEGEGTYEA